MRRVLVSTVSCLALASACGAASSPVGTSQPTMTSSGSSPAAGFSHSAAAKDAKSALLTIDAFPSGWTTSPADVSSEAGEDAKIGKCLNAPAADFASNGPDVVTKDSDNFNGPGEDQSQVSEELSVATPGYIATAFKLLHSSQLTHCLDDYLTRVVRKQAGKGSAKGAKFGAPKVSLLSFPKIGDDTVALRAGFPVTEKGVAINTFFDVVYLRYHTELTEMDFFQLGSAFNTSAAESYCRAAMSKLTSADINVSA